jgi:hypothetical protein
MQPAIMRTVSVPTYVPVLTMPRVIERAYDPNAHSPNPGVVERIRAHIERTQKKDESVPTGDATGQTTA